MNVIICCVFLLFCLRCLKRNYIFFMCCIRKDFFFNIFFLCNIVFVVLEWFLYNGYNVDFEMIDVFKLNFIFC